TTTVVSTQACSPSITILPNSKSAMGSKEGVSSFFSEYSDEMYWRILWVSFSFTAAQNFSVTSNGDNFSTQAPRVAPKQETNSNEKVINLFTLRPHRQLIATILQCFKVNIRYFYMYRAPFPSYFSNIYPRLT